MQNGSSGLRSWKVRRWRHRLPGGVAPTLCPPTDAFLQALFADEARSMAVQGAALTRGTPALPADMRRLWCAPGGRGVYPKLEVYFVRHCAHNARPADTQQNCPHKLAPQRCDAADRCAARAGAWCWHALCAPRCPQRRPAPQLPTDAR